MSNGVDDALCPAPVLATVKAGSKLRVSSDFENV